MKSRQQLLISLVIAAAVTAAVAAGSVNGADASNAAATSPAATAPAPLAAVLQNIGSDTFSTRDAAQRDLAKLPSDQIDILRNAAAGTTDPEVKARLQSRIAEMELDLFLHPRV